MNRRRLAIASDHAGAPLKTELLEHFALIAPHWEPLDLGLPEGDPTDDYPDAARLVAEAMRQGAAERGLLLCGSGIGVAIAAGKYPHVGAARVHDAESAAAGVMSEGLNVLCLGGRQIGWQQATTVLAAFLSADPLD
jgi:ribose 5-phosphate isomerase B